MNPFVAIVICLLAGWMFQIGFATLQIQRYFKRINSLRKLGRCATGMGGSRYKGRIYAALVVDPATRVVVAAEKMTGVSVFAGFRPLSDLVGLPLDALLGESGTLGMLPPKLRTAFGAAAQMLHDSFEPPAAKTAASFAGQAVQGTRAKTAVRPLTMGTPRRVATRLTRRPVVQPE